MLFKPNRVIYLQDKYKNIKSYKEFRDSGLTYAGGYTGLQKAQRESARGVVPVANQTRGSITSTPQGAVYKDKKGESFAYTGSKPQPTPQRTYEDYRKDLVDQGLGSPSQSTLSRYEFEASQPKGTVFHRAVEKTKQDMSQPGFRVGNGVNGGMGSTGGYTGSTGGGIDSSTDWNAQDSSWQRNAKTNAKNAEIAKGNPDFKYTKLPENRDEALQQQLTQQGETTDFVEEQNRIQAELEQLGLSRLSSTLTRSDSASRAGFTQGRSGGAFSEATAQISPAIEQASKSLYQEARTKIQYSQNQRNDLEEKLAKAQQDDNTMLIEQFQEEIALNKAREAEYRQSMENKAYELEQMVGTATAKANDTALDMFKQHPSSMAEMSSTELAQLQLQHEFAGGTFSLSAFYSFQEAAKLETEALNSKNEAEVEYKLAQADKARMSGVREGWTAQEKNWSTYQQLKSTNPEGAKLYAESAGILERPPTSIESQIAQAELEYKVSQTGEKKANALKTLTSLNEQKTLAEAGIDILPRLGQASSGLEAEKLYEQLGLSRLGGDEYMGECAAFTNDLTGRTGRYGSSPESKIANVNNWNIFDPKEGSIFVSNIGNNNHCGFIESVDREAGTVVLFDMNRMGQGKTSRRPVRIEDLKTKEGIIGYEDLTQTTMREGTISEDEQKVEDKVNSILSSTGQTTSGISTAKDLRSRVETRLSERQAELRAKGDIRGVLSASAGGTQVSDSFIQRFSKGKVVVSQLGELTRALTSNKDIGDIEDMEDDEGNKLFDFSPITGWIRRKNPWDANAQEINAIIQGTIPNLARGVFGEVGVLTDRDVELYRKTLPTLNQTDEVKTLVAGLTMRVVKNSLEQSLLTQADNGRNVSGNIRYLDTLDAEIEKIEKRLGISKKEGTTTEDKIADFEKNDERDDIVNELSSTTVTMRGAGGTFTVTPENVNTMKENGYLIVN